MKRKILSTIIIFSIILSMLPVFCVDLYADNGEIHKNELILNNEQDEPDFATKESSRLMTEDTSDIVEITTAEQLIELANTSWDNQEEAWSKTYILANDIDMKNATPEKTMKPIGNSSRSFKGVFDGKNHTIKNLELQLTSESGGLFHSISETATVKNLNLEDANLQFSGASGALVGKNSGTIEKCSVVNSTITATSSTVGGLVGINEGSIEKSFITDSIIKYDNEWSTTTYGGLVGRNTKDGKINQSYASVTIDSKKWTGGLVGWNYGSIENSYSTGVLKGTEEIGGLVGRSDGGSSIANSYANTDVFATVSGSGFIGGLNWGGGTVSNCVYNSGKDLPEKSSTSIAGVMAKTPKELKSEEILETLNSDGEIWGRASNVNDGFPYIIAIAPEPSEQETPSGINIKTMVAIYDKDNYTFKKHIDVTDISIEKENPTVLDILEAGKGTIPYKSSTGKYGEFIESIAGIEAPAPDGWMFTINDKTPPVGVSTATVKAGDKILWYYGSPLNNYKGPRWDELISTSSEIGKEDENFEGKGTKEEPYLIKTADDLMHIMDYPDACFKVNNPIDLEGVSFEPIGTEDKPFMGKFDGNNQEISNLTINKDKDSKNIGFFGVLNNANVVNVKITNANIVGGSRLGVLAGSAIENTNGACLIGNCHVSGTIKGLGNDVIKATRIGGLVGINDGNNEDSYVYSVIDNCSAHVNVIGNTKPVDDAGHVGGLVGWNRGVISNSFATGNVKGGNTTGGLVGSNWGQIYKSHATGNVTGLYTTGGFVGSNNLYSKIENSYSTGNVIGNKASGNNYFGGFAGSTSGSIKSCVSVGTVLPGWSWNGGFAGFYDGSNIEKDIENSYGNSIDCLGRTIKGLGNVIDSTNSDYDKYMAVGVSAETAKEKLNEILDIIPSEKEDSQDKLAVEKEAAKYVDNVVISSIVPVDSNVTKYIVKPKQEMTIDPEISIVYSQREYTGYITDSAPTGQYTLIKQNTTEGNEETKVTLIFVKNGEFATKDIEVTIESTQAINKTTLEEKIKEVEGKYLVEDDYTGESWNALKRALKAAKEIVAKDNPTQEEITEALSELNLSLGNLKQKEISSKEKVYEVIEGLRSYYSNREEFTFRQAIGYNYTSENLEKDLVAISSKFKTNEDPKSASEHVGNIIGLIAAGKDPYDYNNKNYVEALVKSQNEVGKFVIGKNDDYSTTVAWSMLALDMADAKYNRDKAVEALLGYQKNDGSFGGIDETGMVITALAKYKGKAEVQDAINKGLKYLKEQQDVNTGGFIAWGSENPYTASAVLQGLIAVGEDPQSEKWTKDGKTIIDSLMNFYKDGHFEKESEWSKEPDVDMITEQAFIALADVYKGKSMFNEIKLNTNKLAKITIDKPNINKIIEGETIKLNVTGYDSNDYIMPVGEIDWTSSNKEIAEVDKNGNVTTKKSGNVIITAKVKGTDIKDSMDLEISEKEFEIEYIGDTKVANGQQANAKIRLINLTRETKPATLIVTLYNKKTNKLLNYSIVKKELEGKEELELIAGFLVPDIGDYYIKAFLWDDLKDQNIIMQDAKDIKLAS